jgi:hypothetical protein
MKWKVVGLLSRNREKEQKEWILIKIEYDFLSEKTSKKRIIHLINDYFN